MNCVSVYKITNCGQKGRTGPTPQQCVKAYNNTKVKVDVKTESVFKGVQVWRAPYEGFYT